MFECLKLDFVTHFNKTRLGDLFYSKPAQAVKCAIALSQSSPQKPRQNVKKSWNKAIQSQPVDTIERKN